MSEYVNIAESKTIGLNTLSKKSAANGQTIYKFGFGQSPFAPLKQVIEVLKNSAGRKDYMFYKQAIGFSTNAEDIIITPGSWLKN